MSTAIISDPARLCAVHDRAVTLAGCFGLTPAHKTELRRLAETQGVLWEECEAVIGHLPDAPAPPQVVTSGGSDFSWIGFLLLLGLKLGPGFWHHFFASGGMH